MSAIAKLFEATSVREVTDFLADFQSEHRISWRPVGGRDNNLPTINLGSDPAAGVIERITNAIDSIMELEWETRSRPAHLMSPRAAVEQWWGIKAGRLSNVEDLRESSVVEVSKKVQITIRDSERGDRPTIDIRDRGVGLLPEEFASSILSLNALLSR